MQSLVKSEVGEKEMAEMLLHTTLRAPIGMSSIEELDLMYREGDDLNEIKQILGEILAYPSTELAHLHRDAYRLGSMDLVEGHSDRLDFEELQIVDQKIKFCPCCGFIKQYDEIKIRTHLDDVSNIGISTYLYFNTIKILANLLIIMGLIFCLFSLITNIIAAKNYHPPSGSQDKFKSNVDLLVLSLGSKQLNATSQNLTFYDIQAWLGVATLVIWGIYLIFSKRNEKRSILRLQKQSYSASDFSIMIEGVPKDMTHEMMQKQFDEYFENLDHSLFVIKGFHIAKFNMGKPFYLNEERFDNDELKQKNEQHSEMIQRFAGWIEERKDRYEFSTPKAEREEQYNKFEGLKKERYEMYKEITEKIQEEFKNEDEELTATAFVTFESNYEKNIFLSMNNSDIASQIRYCMRCFNDSEKFFVTDHEGNYTDCTVSQAPEPEDVIWTNLGRTTGQMVKRKVITYLITILILGASFGIVYGLSAAQVQNQKNRVLSFAISLVISIINMILQQILRFLTFHERDITQTNHQTSLGLKAVFALLLNSILIPIMVNYFLQHNLYGPNGLAYDVFTLSITNSFLSPLMKIFDVYFLYTRILAWWNTRPNSKLVINQTQLNQYNEYLQFEVGYEYIYIVNLFLFTCFFVTLQPFIVVFAILGLGLMYWAQKYSIFSRCKRPIPGTNLVNTAMFQLIYLGPLFFTLGALSWSTFFPEGVPKRGFIANIVCLCLSVLIFLLPYEAIFRSIFSDMEDSEMKFHEYRVYLPSEYDRLNPATSKAAIREFMGYVKEYRKSLEAQGEGSLKRAQQKFLKQIRQGFHMPTYNLLPSPIFQSGAQRENNFIIGQIFRGEQNAINPLIVGQSVIPTLNKKMPSIFDMLANQGPKKNGDDFLFRKATSILQLTNDFERRDQQMLRKSGFGNIKKSNPNYNAHTSNIYEPTNEFGKIFNLQDKIIDQFDHYQPNEQSGNQGYSHNYQPYPHNYEQQNNYGRVPNPFGNLHGRWQ